MENGDYGHVWRSICTTVWQLKRRVEKSGAVLFLFIRLLHSTLHSSICFQSANRHAPTPSTNNIVTLIPSSDSGGFRSTFHLFPSVVPLPITPSHRQGTTSLTLGRVTDRHHLLTYHRYRNKHCKAIPTFTFTYYTPRVRVPFREWVAGSLSYHSLRNPTYTLLLKLNIPTSL